MSRRPPWTVWVYVTAEMWRLIILTTCVLLCVTAFGVSVKYLADGKLGAADCLKIMFLSMPPMLHYVLPFAACFGATLAYHRLAADNEALACHAGGISHRGLLGPAVLTGVVLAAVLVALSNFIIPRFLEKMAMVISQDATRLIVASIQRKEPVRLNDTWVYADAVAELGPDEKSGSFQRLWMGAVVVVDVDKQGKVRNQGSTREANVWLRKIVGGADGGQGGRADLGDGPMTQVIIKTANYVGTTGEGTKSEGESTVLQFQIPSQFPDDPKFRTSRELKELREFPERISGVERERRKLALALAERETLETLRSRLREKNEVELVNPLGERFVLRASDVRFRPRVRAPGGDEESLRGWYSLEPVGRGEDVVMDSVTGSGGTRRRRASTAWLRLEASDSPGQEISISIQFNDISAEDIGSGRDAPPSEDVAENRSGSLAESRESGYALASGASSEVMDASSADLMRAARARMESRPGDERLLGPAVDGLQRRIDDLLREVLSKRHERNAMALACMVMVVLGSVMALRLRDSLPLTIYLWAFFPALGAVLTVSAGQQLTHEQGFPGLVLLWGGIAALGAYMFVEMSRLSRH